MKFRILSYYYPLYSLFLFELKFHENWDLDVQTPNGIAVFKFYLFSRGTTTIHNTYIR